MSMSLKDFSLLKEDDSNYHIGHPKGRSIVVPKRGLTDHAQKLISRLKKEQNFAEGTPAGTEEVNSSQLGDQGDQLAAEATANPDLPAPLVPDEGASPSPLPTGSVAASPPGEGAAISPASSPGVPSSVEQQATASTPTPEAATPEAQPPQGQTAVPNTTGGLQKAEKSLQAGASAEAKAGRDEAKAHQEAAAAIAKLPTSQDITKQRNASDEKFQKMIRGVDPDRYLNNRSTGTRIAQGIAMLIGGIGSGLTGQANPAMKFIDDSINNDIEAQKNEQGKAMNMWKMAREASGSDQQATLEERNRLLSIAKEKALQAQSGANGAIAQARLAPGILGIDKEIAQNNWMLGRVRGGASGTEAQHVNDIETMKQVHPELAKEMEGKYIPGIGVARRPVGPDDIKELTNYDALGKRINEAIHFQKTEAGSLGTFPGSAANARAQNIQNSIAAELNKLYGLNRLTETEYHNFMQQIPNPGSFRSSASLAKLGDLQGQLEDRKQSVLTGLGVTPFKKAQNDQVALSWAQANPNDPRAKQIMQVASSGAK